MLGERRGCGYDCTGWKADEYVGGRRNQNGIRWQASNSHTHTAVNDEQSSQVLTASASTTSCTNRIINSCQYVLFVFV